MKRILLILTGIFIFACSPKITTDGGEANVGNVMLNVLDKKISMAQFDSLCIADTLPRNLNKWLSLSLKDYENNKLITLFSYMKKDGTVYKLEETMDDSVKITKRKVEMYE